MIIRVSADTTEHIEIVVGNSAASYLDGMGIPAVA